MKKPCILKVMDLGYLKSGGVMKGGKVYRGVARLCEGRKKTTTYVHILRGRGHHDNVLVLNFGISLLVKICDMGLLMLMGLINAVKRDLGLWGVKLRPNLTY